MPIEKEGRIGNVSLKELLSLNPVYAGRLFPYYLLDESICLFVSFILFLMENPVSKQCPFMGFQV